MVSGQAKIYVGASGWITGDQVVAIYPTSYCVNQRQLSAIKSRFNCKNALLGDF